MRSGVNLEVAYFDQHRDALDLTKTVQEIVGEGKQEVMVNGQSRHVLGYLQDFLFSPKRARTPVKALSGGEKNRLLLARLFLRPSNLLILDEPTNGLDPNQTEHMRQLIKRLARRTTIILSTHIMQEVDAVCSRVLMLRNGRLALDQNLTDLHNSKTLMLRASAGAPSLAAYLEQLADVTSLQSFVDAEGLMHFHIHLNSTADIDTAANSVAHCVIQAGAELYQLQVSAHDLDQVFREVYDNGN
jgi:ABC-type multidrug transport system ATPase subunit